MTYLITACLIYMLAVFGYTLVRLLACDRKTRAKRLKNFKRGNFALIYIATIPLYFLALRYNGTSIDGSVWLSVKACIEIIVLKFDYNTVAPLMRANLLYQITVEILFSFVVLNAVLFTISLFGQTIRNKLSLFAARKFGKKVVVVVGANENSLSILSTVPKGQRAILIGDPPQEFRDALAVRKIPYAKGCAEGFGERLKKMFGGFSEKKVTVILNTGEDAESIQYVKQICGLIERENLSSLPLSGEVGLSVCVFTDKPNEATASYYVEKSMGMIRFLNRHALIAADFIDRYPLTQYMDGRELDYDTATVREDVDLNVFMIGFGKCNEKLFLASVSNNQFFTVKDGKLQFKPVTYHLYDRFYPNGKFTDDRSVHSENLHFGYLRYAQFLRANKGREDAFLPLPPEPARVEVHPLEVDHPQFYASLRPALRKKSYNYIIVSFGTDMDNIEFAEKLRQKVLEWGISSFVKIFVKVRDEALASGIANDSDLIELFGSDRRCVYNAEVILREKADRMAKLRHLLYTAEYEVRHGKAGSLEDEAIREAARKKWYGGLRQFQRESNIYACLSARMKLQLCGFDYAESGTDCSAEFEEIYEKGDKRTPAAGLTVAGKKLWDYSNDEQFRASLRFSLTEQEHLRWCANMIANGIVPCEKSEIAVLPKETLLLKRLHGNLTTMEGLVEYREIAAQRTGKSTEETDVIRYDYQLMDDIVWLLGACGYRIVRHVPKRGSV